MFLYLQAAGLMLNSFMISNTRLLSEQITSAAKVYAGKSNKRKLILTNQVFFIITSVLYVSIYMYLVSVASDIKPITNTNQKILYFSMLCVVFYNCLITFLFKFKIVKMLVPVIYITMQFLVYRSFWKNQSTSSFSILGLNCSTYRYYILIGTIVIGIAIIGIFLVSNIYLILNCLIIVLIILMLFGLFTIIFTPKHKKQKRLIGWYIAYFSLIFIPIIGVISLLIRQVLKTTKFFFGIIFVIGGIILFLGVLQYMKCNHLLCFKQSDSTVSDGV